MLKIRLQRTGRKNDPAFRIVVTEDSNPVKGKFLEKLGSFVSTRKDDTLNINLERVSYWISKGAGVSDTLARLFQKKGVNEASRYIKRRVMKPKKEEVKESKNDEVKETKNDEVSDTAGVEANVG